MNSIESIIRSQVMILSMGLVLMQCQSKQQSTKSMETESNTVHIESKIYGKTNDGRQVDEYTMNNGVMEVAIITFGGIITTIKTPDKNGVLGDIVLGLDSLKLYEQGHPYLGSLIGRYGNRIANGRFYLDGVEYTLAKNNGDNHLHGGIKGFDKAVWRATTENTSKSASLILEYLSKDGEEGYPGNLACVVRYTLDSDNNLTVAYTATTDKSTIVNLTQHSYFNLSGDFSQSILDHEVQINANSYLPVDAGLIPTGELASVMETPFDFISGKLVGTDIDNDHEQIILGKGFDHCWVLKNNSNEEVSLAAKVYHPASGRRLAVYTDQPGIQFYTGNFLDGKLPAKGGGTYKKRSGMCLETQHFPNTPNQATFPSVRLDPGQTYSTKTIFSFN